MDDILHCVLFKRITGIGMILNSVWNEINNIDMEITGNKMYDVTENKIKNEEEKNY